MVRDIRPDLILDSMNDRIITFADKTTWKLTSKLSEKPWEGSDTQKGSDWVPSEVHAVYECVQVRGPRPGRTAILKVRIEVPYALPPSNDPSERAKCASGMRLNGYTEQEIESLERVTAACCSATPKLLAVKIETQDESLFDSQDSLELQRYLGNVKWWMPGGYVVYILMSKLPGQPLGSFWDEKVFSPRDRQEIRDSFRIAYLEAAGIGLYFRDHRLTNILWDTLDKKCYLIDLEDTNYDPEIALETAQKGFSEWFYFLWGLARDWPEPHW